MQILTVVSLIVTGAALSDPTPALQLRQRLPPSKACARHSSETLILKKRVAAGDVHPQWAASPQHGDLRHGHPIKSLTLRVTLA